MGKQWRVLSGVFCFLLLWVNGCALLPNNDPVTCDEEGRLLSDDFSGAQDCGWQLYSDRSTVVEIVDGVLQMSAGQPGEFWWTNPRRDFEDVIIVTQARQESGPDDNAYGVICRYQDTENFYIFLISGDGYYAIGKYHSDDSQVQYLTADGQYVYSDILNQGAATNEIRASCVGNELALAVNGIQLVSVTDDAFATGDVGVGVTTFQPGTAVVQFDNFIVTAP